MVKNRGKLVTPSLFRVGHWRLIWMTSFLIFSFDFHRLLVKDLDPSHTISWVALDWCS